VFHNIVAAVSTPLNFADTFIFHNRNINAEVAEEVPSITNDSMDFVLTRDHLIKLTRA